MSQPSRPARLLGLLGASAIADGAALDGPDAMRARWTPSTSTTKRADASRRHTAAVQPVAGAREPG
jgi:hypothetical protein